MVKSSKTANSGAAGEDFVAELLRRNGWRILATRWRCRWGELDIVARDRRQVIFVEVKTRGQDSWDENGLLAVTVAKQKKLWRTALAFLNQYPDLASLPCRFDLALVKSTPNLELYSYLESAFSLENLT